jgi:hypothetical protein
MISERYRNDGIATWNMNDVQQEYKSILVSKIKNGSYKLNIVDRCVCGSNAFEILSEWQLYLTNISTNLMELSDQMEYQIIKLKAEDPLNGFTGITKTKAKQCIDSMGSLWRYFALLSEVVEKANELYKRNSFLNNTEDETREILENATIV